MSTQDYRAGQPWTCRHCGEQLQFSRRQTIIAGRIVAACSFALAYLLGFRGWQLLGVGIILWVAGLLLIPAFFDKYFPRKLERYQPSGFVLDSQPLTLFPHGSSLHDRQNHSNSDRDSGRLGPPSPGPDSN
jgi:hypothetical protein